MISDIFIKTCFKDFIWLEGCLKSIKHFSSGFRNIVIVSDDDHKLPSELFDILPIKVHYVPLPSKRPTYVIPQGIGYLWQQNIKLTWYNYTDADFVIIVDSDQMFKAHFKPEDFFYGDKISWWARQWHEAPGCLVHKETTDIVLGVDTEYETMVCPVFSFDRQITINFNDFLCKKHNVDTFWDVVIKHNLPRLSEYNIFGNYLITQRVEKYAIRFDSTESVNLKIVRTFWSWGGITAPNIEERKNILAAFN